LGAGTKDFRGRANALRLILAEPVVAGAGPGASDTVTTHEPVIVLTADIDDMVPEYLAAAAEALRIAGALDVVLLAATMKKGRLGTRIEVLGRPADADRLETLLLTATTTIGVRRQRLARRVLPRHHRSVTVLGHPIAVKETTLPNGETRAKPEFDDVLRVAEATGRPASDIFALTAEAAHASRHEPQFGPADCVTPAASAPEHDDQDDQSDHSHDHSHDHEHTHDPRPGHDHDHQHGHS
jgi:uncharacterized protein (DUF111 family)